MRRLEEIEERRKLQEAERQKEKVKFIFNYRIGNSTDVVFCLLFTGGPTRKGTSSQGGGG